MIGSPYKDLPKKEGGPVDQTGCRQIADYMRREIERIGVRALGSLARDRP